MDDEMIAKLYWIAVEYPDIAKTMYQTIDRITTLDQLVIDLLNEENDDETRTTK